MDVLVPLVCELGHMQLALLQLLLSEPDSREGVKTTIFRKYVRKPADEEGTQILVIPPEEPL